MTRHRALASFLIIAAIAAYGTARSGPSGGYRERGALRGPLREPVAVEALADGGVAVADFSANLVVIFDRDGTLVWQEDQLLDHPSGLAAADGGLWVADTAHHRLVFFDRLGGDEPPRVVELTPELHPTDVALATEGALWVSCTPDDVLLLVGADGDVLIEIDEAEGSPLSAPRGLLEDREGGVWVVEALGGTIRHFGANGSLLATIGAWGLGEGQFMKPKDLEWMPDGNLGVLDTRQGVIQVITTEGEFVQLVSDTSGPHVFEHALGLAVGGDKLFVADAGAGLVRMLEPDGEAYNNGRFESRAVLFRPISVLSADPSPICRQCHDGTRRLSAGNFDPAARNHPMQVQEHSEMIPASVELNPDGSLKCTSCHQIHAQEAEHDQESTRIVDFGFEPPRERTLESPQVCLDCHGDYVESARYRHRTSHPLGLPPPPEAKLERLAALRSRLDDGAVTCMSCHRPHGALDDHLLIAPAQDGTLCLSCHSQHGPGQSFHPLDMDLDEQVVARIAQIGGTLGPDGKLTCLSCHDPHQAPEYALLRSAGDGESPCESCHSAKAAQFKGGRHAMVGCAACHGMHRPPERATARGGRGVGPQACLDCHTTGAERAPQINLAATHPLGMELRDGTGLPTLGGKMACSTCHDTHGSSSALLRLRPPDLCLKCHGDKGAVAGTDHDAAVVSISGTKETCVSCHRVHGTQPAAYLVPTKPVPDINPASARCLRCHDGTTPATNPGPVYHPRPAERKRANLATSFTGDVWFYGPDGRPTQNLAIGDVACPTCHDPHRWRHGATERPGEAKGDASDSFLRDPAVVTTLCKRCHGPEGETRHARFHDQQFRDTLEVW